MMYPQTQALLTFWLTNLWKEVEIHKGDIMTEKVCSTRMISLHLREWEKVHLAGSSGTTRNHRGQGYGSQFRFRP